MHWLRKEQAKGETECKPEEKALLFSSATQSKLQPFVDEAPPGGGAYDQEKNYK